MEAHLLTWAPPAGTTLRLLAAEAPAGDDYTAQIIVALIGALALILVALVPALVNRQQKKDATTTPSPPAPVGASPEEMVRVWAAIEGLRDGQQRSFREHAGYDALLDECRRDSQQTDATVARHADEHRRDIAALREQVHKHIYGPGHGAGA